VAEAEELKKIFSLGEYLIKNRPCKIALYLKTKMRLLSPLFEDHEPRIIGQACYT
jgi:hypothetical protein